MHQAHRGYPDLAGYRQTQLRHGVIFALVTALCFGLSLVSAEETDWLLYFSGWAVALAGAGLAWIRPSLWLLAPFGALTGAILVRAGTDGLDAGLGPLLLIPVLAVAGYGSRLALVVMLACVGAGSFATYLAANGEGFSLSPIWRQDILLVVMAAVLGIVIQDLVTRMRRERNLADERGRMIEELALTDPLTGIDNRRGWERAIGRSIGQAGRRGQPLALAMLDLDHFKQYNDTYGHQAGDEYLHRAATAWEQRSRAEDQVARYGGDEFVVTMPDTDLAGARTIIERLCHGLPVLPTDPEVGITCSAGIAEWDGTETAGQLLARADGALYTAKETGRDRVVAAGSREQVSRV